MLLMCVFASSLAMLTLLGRIGSSGRHKNRYRLWYKCLCYSSLPGEAAGLLPPQGEGSLHGPVLEDADVALLQPEGLGGLPEGTAFEEAKFQDTAVVVREEGQQTAEGFR